jgi:hypothetical protein
MPNDAVPADARPEYDPPGRRTALWMSAIYNSSAGKEVVPGDTVGYTYDIMGNVLTVSNRAGCIVRTYFANGSVKKEGTARAIFGLPLFVLPDVFKGQLPNIGGFPVPDLRDLEPSGRWKFAIEGLEQAAPVLPSISSLSAATMCSMVMVIHPHALAVVL